MRTLRRTLCSALLAGTLSLAGAATAAAQDPEPLYDLLDAAAQRLLTADPVAASKWLTGGPITDPARVRQVLEAVTAEAGAAGTPPEYLTAVFTDQINATEAVQYSRFSWWKLDPAAAPRSAPDLSASRTVIDALNRRMVDEIAEQWEILNSTDCPLRVEAAKSHVAEALRLDPLYRQALDAATRSYCDG